MVLCAGMNEDGKIGTLILGLTPVDLDKLRAGKSMTQKLGPDLPEMLISCVPSEDDAVNYIRQSCAKHGQQLVIDDRRQPVADPT